MTIQKIELSNERSPEFQLLIGAAVAAEAENKDIHHPSSPDGYDVVFQVNGVDVDFKKVALNLYNAFERSIGDEAAKLLRRKAGDVCFQIDNLADVIERQYRERLDD